MHDVKTNFDKFLEVLKSVLQEKVDLNGNFHKVGAKPKFSDIELISQNRTSGYLSIYSESLLFKKLKSNIKNNFLR